MTESLRSDGPLPCRIAPDLFFAPDGARDTKERVRDAKAMCQLCPIQVACRDEGRRLHAVGIWGGEDDTERTDAIAELGPTQVEPSAADTVVETAKRTPRRPVEHGTRPGYQRHRRRGEAACDPCRFANAAADRLLRTTGSTKAST
ncbi:hypothetical protein P3T35_003130 [Kitasatospora sp. GP30]|uniref:WhiB family transcriptional regulator n=1 Tax=Kitasatospora sp. GP30 TaxID=3035084 RepID=UPI000C7049A6|nr:WhiB family transcriptional regulator [Kitasatospora sp. GP30]MDH6141117.1 hypothetical protein [Kitasatospora sp. GP30]